MSDIVALWIDVFAYKNKGTDISVDDLLQRIIDHDNKLHTMFAQTCKDFFEKQSSGKINEHIETTEPVEFNKTHLKNMAWRVEPRPFVIVNQTNVASYCTNDNHQLSLQNIHTLQQQKTTLQNQLSNLLCATAHFQ